MTTTTCTERPSETDRTPAETPSALAREIAQLATAPTVSFGALINDEDRDRLFQRLTVRLEADEPDTWSHEREREVITRLEASLSTDEDRTLFGQYSDQRTTEVDPSF